MNFNFGSRKRTVFLAVLLVVAAVLGGFFWWYQKNKSSEGRIVYEKKISEGENYIIKDTPKGKFIENQKEGFIAGIPNEWQLKVYGSEVDLLSPEVKLNQQGQISLGKGDEGIGCGIIIQIVEYNKSDSNIEIDAERIARYIKEIQEGQTKTELKGYEVIVVGLHNAIKKVFENRQYTSVQVPMGRKIYFFDTFLKPEKCAKEFFNFLKTVSIQ